MKKTIEHNKWASLDNLVLNEQIKVVIYLYYRFCNKEVVVLHIETSLRIWPQLFSETYLEVLFSEKKIVQCVGHFSSVIFIARNSQPLIWEHLLSGGLRSRRWILERTKKIGC